MDHGLRSSYKEVANVSTSLSMMGFEANRLSKIASKQANELVERDEVRRHFID